MAVPSELKIAGSPLAEFRATSSSGKPSPYGPDPLHLATMFGLDLKAAIRYAENARQLLITAAEEHKPGGWPDSRAYVAAPL
jgi:hypothetical protein